VTVVLLRHGETEWSVARRHTGRTDIPLTPAGREQAARAAARMSGRAFALVLTSPLRRARETAELAGLGAQAQEDADLLEWHYGAAEGRTTAEIREEQPGWTVWGEGPDGGETVEQVAARADNVNARASGVEGDVAIVAHAHLLRILGARWVDLDPRFGARLKLDTAAVCELGREREVRAIDLWNDTSHLADR
jgi:broad specificity phosphatase PhoE